MFAEEILFVTNKQSNLLDFLVLYRKFGKSQSAIGYFYELFESYDTRTTKLS